MRRIQLLALLLLAMSCSAPPPSVDGIAVLGSDDFAVSVFAEEFDGPTQMVLGPDGDLFVAELNGAENDRSGRVLRVSMSDPSDRSVLQVGLDKPTGIAVAGERLWIMERDQLTVTTLTAGADREVIAGDLPNNGRSQGTLTLTPEGDLLYNTSGSKRGADRVAGSGMIFRIVDAATGDPKPEAIASGFKHAYAHLVDPDGQLWAVEMTDGRYDDQRAQDELLALTPGDDAGWPQCVDDNRPVAEFGGTIEGCANAPRSHALFAAGATPTSFVLAPWDDDLFIVTLWLPGRVITVPSDGASTPHAATDFILGIDSPQHVLVDGDRILLSDHATGRIFSISPG